jgi:YVTN family beta-propeller protein
LIAEIPIGLEPVSANPLDNDEMWVVNHVSDSVSVVRVSQGLVVDTLEVKDEPCDVVFAGSPLRAFVSAARSNEVRVFDLTTHAQLASIALQGDGPRALAVSANRSKVYVAFATSGNRTTTLEHGAAPLQPPPTNPLLPIPPRTALIIDATDPIWAPSVIPYTVLDHDVAEIDTATLAVAHYFDRVGTVNLGIAVRPTTGELYVANTDALNLIRYEPDLRGHFVDNRVTRIKTGIFPVVTPVDLNPGVNYGMLPNSAALSTALAQPTAMVFDPAGSVLYVAAFGTDRVAKLDAGCNVLARIQIGPGAGSSTNPRQMRGPRGLALHASAQRLYVQNRVSNTLSIVDTASDNVLAEIPVGSYDPTPAAIREGRGFLYDAKLSGNGSASCAACHVDGETDALAWDLGDPAGDMLSATDPKTGVSFPVHPMKGPMVTPPLQGLAGFAPFHWQGDRADLAAFNPAFDGLMGSTQISDADMRAFADFINTIRYEPNPNLLLDRSLPATLQGADPRQGLLDFLPGVAAEDVSCHSCHPLPPDLAPEVMLRGTTDLAFKVPLLRNFYRKATFSNLPGAQNVRGFGITHDGTGTPFLPNGRIEDRAAYLLCFDTGTAPAVGVTRTVRAANASDAALIADVGTLQARAIAGDCDLIGKGRIDGVLLGLLWNPSQGVFTSDRTGVGPFSWSALQAKALAGVATFSLMGVPRQSGVRLGVDRDLDGVLDGDERPLAYCTAKMNSLGCTPVIGWTGTASAGATSGFIVSASSVRNHKAGMLMYGTHGVASIPFQGGTLCVKGPIRRTPGVVSSGSPMPANDCSGVYAFDMNAFASGSLGGNPLAALSIAGTVVDCQWWGRDPGLPAPDNTTLSDALEYVVAP